MSGQLDAHRHFVHTTCLIVQKSGIEMDPISDIFKTMRITGVVHARLEATAPWGLLREGESWNGAALRSPVGGHAPSQLAHFGMISRGNCWLSV
jgi:hypothetical protein